MTAASVPRLILVDMSAPLCSAWRNVFDGRSDVTVVMGRFEDLPAFDCVVAASNSYGIMDGGIDAAIRERFPRVEQRVEDRIRREYHGYQPVGTSRIVPTDDADHPWVAHTPTMRVPKPLTGEMVLNIHAAMWAMLCAIRAHNRTGERPIETVACGGLGTGHGRVRPATAARLMALAFTYQVAGPPPPKWSAVRRREGELGSAGGYQRSD